MGIPVKLEAFEGPLDLLLHLIEKNKIDIYDIPIVLVTDQYMEYIDKMGADDIEVVSEFLVMAATLVRIKSKMLLPPGEVEEEEEEDPRAELVRCLLEYKMYKYASFQLKDRQLDAAMVAYKAETMPDEIADYKEVVELSELLSDVTLNKLYGVFKSVMQRRADKIDPIRSNFGTIKKVEVNLAEQIAHIEEYAARHGQFSFRGLLDEREGRMYVIVTFLGVLELIKVGKLWIKQDDMFDDIQIFAGSGESQSA